jgi:CDP-glucose 4,6-dehydratase
VEKGTSTMESMGIKVAFWKGKRIFLTGHTGFKGTWLSIWLLELGAKIKGYSLQPPTEPSLYNLCNMDDLVDSTIGDIRDFEILRQEMQNFKPDIVIHMAAQPLVRESYNNPIDTYSTNVMGTVHILEAVRNTESVKVFLNITTDKCYDNKEWVWGYRENDQLGGYDPYSNSKACSELVTSAYRNSFFQSTTKSEIKSIASARAGNVIGGGDWATDRLIPDFFRALLNIEPIMIRNPHAIRPWQHVLEPLSGYLLLCEQMYQNNGQFSQSWNFGPSQSDAQTVEYIVKQLCDKWDNNAGFVIDQNPQPHEAYYLKLDCSKANSELGWFPKWNLDIAIDKIVEWNKRYLQGNDVRTICIQQIVEYQNA